MELLALATSAGEAISTGVLAVFFALLSWAGFHRKKRSLGIFYLCAAAFAVALTVAAAAGHVFSGY